MGIKFLRFRTFPWCFHVMGNHFSCVHQVPSDPSGRRTVKLIKSDGLVKIYHRPVNAAELMLEFPKHLICHSDSFLIGQKIPALSENDELKLGHKYFLLPKHFFQSVLSFVTIASFASGPSPSASSLPEDAVSSKKAFLKKAATCKPFEVHKTPSGTLQIRVSDEFIAQLMEEGRLQGEEEGTKKSESSGSEGTAKGKVCTTPQLQKDYTQLVGCRRSLQWKPKLETIKEKDRKRLGAFGIKRRRKSQSKATSKSQKTDKKLPKVKAAPPPPPPSAPSSSSSSSSKNKILRSEKKQKKVKTAPSPPPPPLPPALASRKIRGKKAIVRRVKYKETPFCKERIEVTVIGNCRRMIRK
ncbi:hypothetical protein H6P81_013471 [Aristolochia fimbriata]|uniref:DUF4228 domain-containing protein n=1 Tax=Aristolochia fimbriata TaxID=158543 RepID=A0AAV7EF24_ARIFI|nr:hypothetical protein H6P81_013471 [Aristolochia fimbriata]